MSIFSSDYLNWIRKFGQSIELAWIFRFTHYSSGDGREARGRKKRGDDMWTEVDEVATRRSRSRVDISRSSSPAGISPRDMPCSQRIRLRGHYRPLFVLPASLSASLSLLLQLLAFIQQFKHIRQTAIGPAPFFFLSIFSILLINLRRSLFSQNCWKFIAHTFHVELNCTWKKKSSDQSISLSKNHASLRFREFWK